MREMGAKAIKVRRDRRHVSYRVKRDESFIVGHTSRRRFKVQRHGKSKVKRRERC